jgi:outer membrane protein assembly factor BamA
VPEDDYLLNKVKIDVDNKNIQKGELNSYLRQKSNSSILGFWKFHLGIYNLSSKKKKEGWLKRIGEAPVVYNENTVDISRSELKKYMRNKGYYEAVVSDTVILKDKKKKAYQYYSIKTNEPYRINKIGYVVEDDSLESVVVRNSENTILAEKQNFDMDVLAGERQRVLRGIQNGGFYRASPGRIFIEADTTKGNHLVDLDVVIGKEEVRDSLGNVVSKNHERYRIRNYYYDTSYESMRRAFIGETSEFELTALDTVRVDNHYFISKGKKIFKNDILLNANHIRDSLFYNVNLIDRTYNEISSLRLFKMINIQFRETNESDSLGNPFLDCVIQLTPGTRQSYSFGVEGTNSSGDFGAAGNLNYQHKNLFKGGEIFDLQFRAGYENLRYGEEEHFGVFEYGADAKITLPKFFAPIKGQSLFRYSTPKTIFNTSYSYQNRPEYKRTIVRASYGYQWKTSKNNMHRFNLVDFNFIKVFDPDSAFIESIENLSIRSSYFDHTISATNYIFTYNTQNIQKRTDYTFLRTTLETAGNLMYLMSNLLDRPKEIVDSMAGPQYLFGGTPFAQYVKGDIEYRRGWVLDKYNTIVFRGFAGLAMPYGNSMQIPYEIKYFAGGANSIRAWAVRTLGPGTYEADPTEYPNQAGDIKLETNLEYRFKMISRLEGALFLDVGNIWSINDNREGAEFDLSSFYREFAVGTGVGTRFDFTYVVLRLDLGLKLRDPGIQEGSKWIVGNRGFISNDLNLNFAIGYPF